MGCLVHVVAAISLYAMAGVTSNEWRITTELHESGRCSPDDLSRQLTDQFPSRKIASSKGRAKDTRLQCAAPGGIAAAAQRYRVRYNRDDVQLPDELDEPQEIGCLVNLVRQDTSSFAT